MIKYTLVQIPIAEIGHMPHVVEELLSSGWSLAGNLCVVHSDSGVCLIQPMIKETHTPAEWFAKRRSKQC